MRQKIKKIQQPNYQHTEQAPEESVSVAILWVHTQKCQQDMASKYLPQLTSSNHSPLFQETTSSCSLQKDVHLLRVTEQSLHRSGLQHTQFMAYSERLLPAREMINLCKSQLVNWIWCPTSTGQQPARPTHREWLADTEKQKSWPEQKQSTLSRYHSVCGERSTILLVQFLSHVPLE